MKKELDLECTPGAIVLPQAKGGERMTIHEVSEKFGISQDTLRYYERIGLIPPVTRTSGGVRNYQAEDLNWVEHTVCMRSAGVSVEALIEYLRLFQQGDETFGARLQLLSEQLENLEQQKEKLEVTIARLQYKISRYKEAVETGVLDWTPTENKE